MQIEYAEYALPTLLMAVHVAVLCDVQQYVYPCPMLWADVSITIWKGVVQVSKNHYTVQLGDILANYMDEVQID